MSDFNRGYARSVPADRADMSVDAGLRSFMLGVYNKVALGLVLSAALAFLTRSAPAGPRPDVPGRRRPSSGYTLLGMIVAFARVAVLLVGGFALRNPTPRSVGHALLDDRQPDRRLAWRAWCWSIPAPRSSSTFLITATAFGGLSLVGYTTKKDLTGMGSFLIMGVCGLLIACWSNMFLHSSLMQLHHQRRWAC